MKERQGGKIERLSEGHIVESFKYDNRMNLFCSLQGVIDHL